MTSCGRTSDCQSMITLCLVSGHLVHTSIQQIVFTHNSHLTRDVLTFQCDGWSGRGGSDHRPRDNEVCSESVSQLCLWTGRKSKYQRENAPAACQPRFFCFISAVSFNGKTADGPPRGKGLDLSHLGPFLLLVSMQFCCAIESGNAGTKGYDVGAHILLDLLAP